jgi:hypothetical protein
MIVDISTALAHARIARAARVRIAAARVADDGESVARWTRHEQANMVCFRMDLDEARKRNDATT